MLIYAAAAVGLAPLAIGALVLFLIAAAGGTVLNLNDHWKNLALPKWLVVVHALLAVVGFVMLVMASWAVMRGQRWPSQSPSTSWRIE